MAIPKPKNDELGVFFKRCMGDKTMGRIYRFDQILCLYQLYDSNKEDFIENDAAIRAVEETDDSYIIEFVKANPDSEETVDETVFKDEEKEL